MNDYNAALYIRLSREDESNKESESIKNQRLFLRNYAKEKNYTIYKEYIDDGYTGTNFDRPAFNELIKDVELKKINMIIVKDLSRLGRNTIETSEYLERYFPRHNIRFVAILDDIDTAIDTYGNEMLPFKVFINSYYNKETSKKIKTTLKNKKQQGLFMGWKAPYGYKKDKRNKYHLVIDDCASKIVKEIFSLALLGNSSSQIADILSKRGVKTPRDYAKLDSNIHTTHLWCARSVADILSNETYIGNLTQGRRKKIYGINLEVRTKRCEWIVVNNTHKPLIDKSIFDIVQKMQIKRRMNNTNNFLLAGLILCMECGHSIGITKSKNRKWAYTGCNYYRKYSKFGLCMPHTNNYNKLEDEILIVINKILENNINKEKLIYILKKELLKDIDYYKIINDFFRSRFLLENIINKILLAENKDIDIYLNFKVNI